MRISDWSSDVCSSDLEIVREILAFGHQERGGRRNHAERIGFGHDPELEHSDTIFGAECLGHRPRDIRAANHDALALAERRLRGVEMCEGHGSERGQTHRNGQYTWVKRWLGQTGVRPCQYRCK